VLRAAGILAVASVAAALAAPGCIIDWADDCAHDRDYPGCKGVLAASSGGAGAGAGGTSGTGTTDGGGGGSVECTDASTCPAVPAGPCAALGTSACVGGKCTVTYTAGDAPSQLYGDCTKSLCAADGGFTTVDAGDNFFNDGNPCTTDACVLGKPANTPMLAGTSCLLPTMVQGVCEPNPDPTNMILLCATCDPSIAGSCSSPARTCSQGSCLLPHCSNGVKDGTETDTDCGGTDCLPCGTMSTCLTSKDCFSQRCIGGVCPMPSCVDGIQNGAETDTDCGGGSCPPCAATLGCSLPRDCQSHVCKPANLDAGPMESVPDTCQAPTCTDGVKNGAETGIDCGNDGGDAGPLCPPCATP
jgi:hypothetical protein